MKSKKKEFQKACLTGDSKEKQRAKFRYMASQKELWNAIEQANIKNNWRQTEEAVRKGQDNPKHNMGSKKKSQGLQGTRVQHIHRRWNFKHGPYGNKKHIANYFDDIYQVGEGTEEYKCWTKHIKKQVRKSIETHTHRPHKSWGYNQRKRNEIRNKKSKTEKEPGPRQNPKRNLHWSEQRNERDTKRSNWEIPQILRNTPQLGGGWNHKNTQGERTTGEMLKWKRNNHSQQYREGIRENDKWKSIEKSQ